MEVKLTLKNYRCFSDDKPATVILRDDYIAFIGVNNAGKSSILKSFYELRPLFARASYAAGLGPAMGITDIDNATYGGPGGFVPSIFQSDPTGIYHKSNDRPLSIEVETLEPNVSAAESNVPPVTRALITVPRYPNGAGPISIRAQWRSGNTDEVSGIKITGQLLMRGDERVATLQPLLSACGALAQAYYVGSFRNALNLDHASSVTVSNGAQYFDIRVGRYFIQEWSQAQGGMSAKQNEAAHRVTSDIKRIFRFSELQFLPTPDNQTITVMVDGQSYKLHELGSGLAQFFLVLANAALRDPRPSFILIDEPELNLHPSLQLDFLTTLASYAQNGVWFATHSLGLARTIAQPIYAVYRDEYGISTVSEFHDSPEWFKSLGELSFSGRPELGFDTLLLVEGKLDVATVQEFLRLYRKDHKVMVWPMNGSASISPDAGRQLQEAKRITDRIYALIDSERTQANESLSSEREGFVRACVGAGVKCKVLEYRAIENYLSERAIKAVIGTKARALTPYQALGDAQPSWHKRVNWRIANRMHKDELENSDLGQFLESL